MRLAYKVWAGIAVATFALMAMADLGGGPSATTAAVVRPVPTISIAPSIPTTYGAYGYLTTAPTSSTTTTTGTTTTTAPPSEDMVAPDVDRPSTRRPGTAAAPAAPRSTRSSGGGGSYANCSAAKAAGAAPLYRGQPGYASKLDRDGDGIACET